MERLQRSRVEPAGGLRLQQNLTLRQAGFRVLEARLQLAIARGEFFPQTQTANGGYKRVAPPTAGGIRGVRIDVPRPVELRFQPGLGD